MEDHIESNFWHRLRPGVRAGLIAGAAILLLDLVNVLTAGAGTLLTYPIQLIVCLGNGALAAYLADVDRQRGATRVTKPGQEGLLAGLILAPIVLADNLILLLGAGLLTVGVGLVAAVPIFGICLSALDVVLALGGGPLGDWLYGRFARAG